MTLFNKIDKKVLKESIKGEGLERTTVSFYRYVIIDNPNKLRDDLYLKFDELQILGRIYLANEGINAQISVPDNNWDKFTALLNSYKYFGKLPMKIAVENSNTSFYKLIIKVKK